MVIVNKVATIDLTKLVVELKEDSDTNNTQINTQIKPKKLLYLAFKSLWPGLVSISVQELSAHKV